MLKFFFGNIVQFTILYSKRIYLDQSRPIHVRIKFPEHLIQRYTLRIYKLYCDMTNQTISGILVFMTYKSNNNIVRKKWGLCLHIKPFMTLLSVLHCFLSMNINEPLISKQEDWIKLISPRHKSCSLSHVLCLSCYEYQVGSLISDQA